MKWKIIFSFINLIIFSLFCFQFLNLSHGIQSRWNPIAMEWNGLVDGEDEKGNEDKEVNEEEELYM